MASFGDIDASVDGKGDAIVLLHGFPLTREIWSDAVPNLARGARTIAPDLRGMGSSRVTPGPYLMESLAGDIAGVLDALGIERANIVGHSLGGYVALAFARMYTERVTRLVLVCSTLSADTAEVAAARYTLADAAESQNSIEPVVESYVPRLFAPAALHVHVDAVARVERIIRQNSPRGAAAMLRGMAQRGASDDIAPELAMPVAVIAGEEDALFPPARARETAALFPHAALETIAGSGHLPMIEAPDAFSAALARRCGA